MTNFPTYESLKTIFYKGTGLGDTQRARVVSAWDDYFREFDAETPEVRERKLRGEAQKLLSGRRSAPSHDLDTRLADSEIPQGLVEDLEAAEVDQQLMQVGGWTEMNDPSRRHVQNYLLQLLREYGSPQLSSLAPAQRRLHLENQLKEWYKQQQKQ